MGEYSEIQAVIFDIDGTLANCEHRRHFVSGKKKDFKAFYDEMAKDSVKPLIRGLCNMYYMNNWHVIICTGRPERYRAITEKWLKDHGVMYKELHMRPEDRECDPDFEVKEDMLHSILERGIDVVLAVDDRDQVVKMWRHWAITCLQVDYGDF